MDANSIISNIVDSLKQINGVSAIVLGGSRARGSDTPASDIDIGIYYHSKEELDLARLRQAAAFLDDDHRENLITGIGGWGPWINGGGWLQVEQTPVDFLFRDYHKVSQVTEQCVKGDITIDYQPGHPHGFVNAIYFAEIALCKVLWDPSGVIAELKRKTVPYPTLLQKATIEKFFWEAAFSADNGWKGIYKRDLSYIAGCCFRAVACLNQVLFAINETYLMNEKGAAAIADSFNLVPGSYSSRVNEIFNLITENPERSTKALTMLRDLIQETDHLVKSKSILT